MKPVIQFESKTKNVRIWSGRRKCAVNVEVSYNRIKAGDFTLLQIRNLRDGENDRHPLQSAKAA